MSKALANTLLSSGQEALSDEFIISLMQQRTKFENWLHSELRTEFRISPAYIINRTRFNRRTYLLQDRKRKGGEVLFSELCDQSRIKPNYAKSCGGFSERFASELGVVCALQRVNVEKGRPLNQIKHA